MRLVLGVTRDHIVDGTRPHHHAYAATFPWYVPLKDYRGEISIEDRTEWVRHRMDSVMYASNPGPEI